MSERAPLPGSRVLTTLTPAETRLTGVMQAALFFNRRRRLERFRKAGAGFPDPALIVNAGIGITPPITVTQGTEPVTLSWSFEFFDGATYPVGTLLDTGETVVALTALGVLTVDVPSVPTNTISVDLSDPSIFGGGVPPFGRHTISVYLDPTGNRSGLYVDGDQVGQDTGAFAAWADGVTTWEYMNTVTDADAISVMEIFPSFTPSTFVG